MSPEYALAGWPESCRVDLGFLLLPGEPSLTARAAPSTKRCKVSNEKNENRKAVTNKDGNEKRNDGMSRWNGAAKTKGNTVKMTTL